MAKSAVLAMKLNLPVTDVEHKFPNDPSAKIISLTDTKGIITEVNDTFVQMCGYSREELIGHAHNIVRHPDMPEQIFKMMWDKIQSGESFMGIIKNRCKNGDYYWVNAYIMPIMQEGKVVGYESVRTAATPEQIARATKYYQMLKAGKEPSKRLDLLNLGSYGLLLASFGLSFWQHDHLTSVLCFFVSLGVISYILYRKNHLLNIVTCCFDSHSNELNSLIYTAKAGREGAVLYDVLYNLKEVDTILTRVKETSDRLMQIANNGLNRQAESVSAANSRSQQVKGMLEDMNTIAGNISHMISDISASAQETVHHSDEAEYLVSEGKDMANQTMTVIDHLSESINQIAEAINSLAQNVADIEKAAADGNADAALALNVLAYSARSYIGAFAANLGGLDAISFSGGIGENSPQTREKILAPLEFMGVVIDRKKNEACVHKKEGIISSPESKVKVAVISANEEIVIAREAAKLLSKTSKI